MSKRPLALYVTAQGISNLGDSVRFIAVTILLFNLTGSGVSASLGMAFSVLPSIMLSPLAGALGDIFPEKLLLSALDLLRCLVVLLFISETNAVHIYLLLLLLAGLDMFYSPSRRKFVLRISGKKGVLKANSLLTGFSGAAYLLGPLIASMLVSNAGTYAAFYLNALTYMLSAFLTLLVGPSHMEKTEAVVAASKRKVLNEIFYEIKDGIRYIRRTRPVREVIMTGSIISFCTISMNMAFYPFAFETLNVTSSGWSVMISIYYGTNLFAIPLMTFLNRRPQEYLWRVVHKSFIITAVIWFMYFITKSLFHVLLLQFIEGTAAALYGILIASRMQAISKKGFIARVGGINDIVSSVGKLAGMGLAFCIMIFDSCTVVFLVNSIILMLFSICCLISDNRLKQKENQKSLNL